MKKLLLTIPLIFLTPLSAFAFSLTGTPANIYADSPSLSIVYDGEATNCWVLTEEDTEDSAFDRTPAENLVIENVIDIFNITIPKTLHLILMDNTADEDACWLSTYADFINDPRFLDIDIPIYVSLDNAPISGGGGGILFGTHYPESGSDNIGTSTTGLMAAVGFVSTDTFGGIFPYLMLSVGVFIGFYIIQQIVMFFGSMSREKAETKKSWSGEGKMEHEYTAWKKKARSRKKRGLDIE